MRNPATKDRLTIRIDHERKERATQIADSMGTDLPNLVNMFLAQVVQENGMPFKPTNDQNTIELDEALADVKAGRTTTFTNADDLFKHIHQLEDSAND
ncbi:MULTISPECIES: type II toxin-antitoxin system RelB/DinJ family antitoxin [Levilactobacillus]|nr:type II toxin-antitoxin system RelB/DinJ family antitoxin [Levilactobacillus sp. 244-2]